MKKIFACSLVFLWLCAVPCVSFADRAYDFSDLETFQMPFPFTVTNIEKIGQGIDEQQVYHITESFDAVVKKFSSMYDKTKAMGDFYVIGLTEQMGDPMYQVQFAYRNEHHYAQIRPEGSGTTITLKVFPVSYVSGVYGNASYGFHMPDGGMVSPVFYTDE